MKKLNNLNGLISIIILLFTIYVWYINEARERKRIEKQQAEEREHQMLDNIIRTTTISRLDRYHDLLHTQRERPYVDLYEKLNELTNDSSIYLDVDFKTMISNHCAKLQFWHNRAQNEMLDITRESLLKEHTELQEQNRSLYISLSSKYNFPVDETYFEDIYQY